MIPRPGCWITPPSRSKLATEEQRRQRYGLDYTVAIVRAAGAAASEDEQRAQRTSLADLLMRTSRIVDCCAALPGGSFAVLFPHSTADDIVAWHARLTEIVAATNLLHPSQPLAVMVGVADSRAATGSALLALAAQRLA